MKNKGKLIVIEGLDGSGKATQTANLAAWMQQKGYAVTQVSFPDYNSGSSALVKMYLDGRMGQADQVNAYAASSFYAADRYISFQNNWKKVYESGHTILSDRYATSNAAHQMPKLPKEQWDSYLAWLEDYEYNRLALPKPDVVVYLDMHPETSRILLQNRYSGDDGKMDIHERDLAYLVRCRTAALYAAEKLGWRIVRCCDGRQPYGIDNIFEQIIQAIFGEGKDL